MSKAHLIPFDSDTDTDPDSDLEPMWWHLRAVGDSAHPREVTPVLLLLLVLVLVIVIVILFLPTLDAQTLGVAC